MRTLALVVGVLLTVTVTLAAFASMLVPRANRSGLAHIVTGAVLVLMIAPIRLFRTFRARDRWLRLAAPISVLVQLAVFVALVIVGVALIVYGQYDLTWKQAAWQGAATVTTLGTTEAVNWSSAVTATVGAFLGLVVIAVFMGYLVGLYSAYVSRESVMARFAQLAGEPAWGPRVLVRSQRLSGRAGAALDCAAWGTWMTDVRLGHQASPVLGHFRSPDPLRHWVVTMLAMLDATALALALGQVEDRGEAVRCVAEGAVTLGVLRRGGVTDEWRNWQIEEAVLSALGRAPTPTPTHEHGHTPTPTLTDGEWELAVVAGVAAGVADRDAFAAARPTFEAIRACYVDDSVALARALHAVAAPWSGTRDRTAARSTDIRARTSGGTTDGDH